MSTRAARWIAIVLLAFSSFSLPGLIPPPDQDPDLLDLAEKSIRNESQGKAVSPTAVQERYNGFLAERRVVWFTNVLFFVFSVGAAVATLWRPKVGIWLVLLVCAYLLYVSGPPFTRMAIEGGFLNFVSLVFSASTRHHGMGSGLVLFWHIVVAPFAYALLALAGIYLCWQTIRGRNRESNP